MEDSESTTKINKRPSWALFLILLTSVVIYKDFWMETRLCNIFETTKAIIFTNTILGNPYKVLQYLSNRTVLKKNIAYLISKDLHNFQ